MVIPASFRSKASKNVSEYLDPEAVCFLNVDNRDQAIDQLVAHLSDCYHFDELKQPFHSAVIEREQVASTGIGQGVALPHAKLASFDDFFIAIGVVKKGIDWQAIDGSAVTLIFLIAGPDDKQCEYLKILSQLTMILRDQDLRNKLLSFSQPHQIIDAFQQFQEI